MANAGFYNVNEYRQYPFVDRPDVREARRVLGLFDLPEQLIVDCGFIMGLDSAFEPARDVVYLSKLEVTAQSYIFTFKTTAQAAAAESLVFTRSKVAEVYESWVYEDQASAPSDDNQCAAEPLWEGFIVTGNLQQLNIAVGVYEFAPVANEQPYIVEPALIQSLVRSYLRSISVANYARTIVPECASSESSSQSASERQIITQATCLNGNIQFIAGINCSVLQTDLTNTITIGPVLGANYNSDVGTELCENHGELPLFAGEAPPAGSAFLSGGPACNELISTINGVGGPNVIINTGPGITLTVQQAVPGTNTNPVILLGISDVVLSQEC